MTSTNGFYIFTMLLMLYKIFQKRMGMATWCKDCDPKTPQVGKFKIHAENEFLQHIPWAAKYFFFCFWSLFFESFLFFSHPHTQGVYCMVKDGYTVKAWVLKSLYRNTESLRILHVKVCKFGIFTRALQRKRKFVLITNPASCSWICPTVCKLWLKVPHMDPMNYYRC